MKAAVFHGPRNVRCEDIAMPTLEEGDVLVRVRACGICGSDLHTYHHGMLMELGSPVESGHVLGHEFSGEIVEINGEVPGKNVGDRVIAIGVGGNAEYVRIPKAMTGTLLSFDETVDFNEVSTTEPLACSLHAMRLSDAKDEETHVIIGAGIIGLGILQCLKATTSATVVVVDLSDARLENAKALGADITLNARNTDIVAALSADANDKDRHSASIECGPVDVVYDCAGMGKNFTGVSVFEQALNIVRVGGKVVVIALFERNLDIDFNLVVKKGIQVIGSRAWSMEEFVEAFELIKSGQINRKPLVSHVYSLDDSSEAYEMQLAANEAIKVILTP